MMRTVFTFGDIKKVRIIGPDLVGFGSFGTYHDGVTLELQDDGQTLRIAPIEKEES